MFGIRSKDWNAHILHLSTRYPLRVQVPDPLEPRHPWKITPSYDSTRKRWTASVLPGSVNCRIATITMPFGKTSDDFQKYIRQVNPDRSYGQTTPVPVPLDFTPAMDLNFREIGGDAAPIAVSGTGGNVRPSYETIPTYFVSQGVRRPGQSTPPPPNTRRLFASDIVLRQPRSFLTNDISSTPNPLGGSIVSVNAVPSTPAQTFDPPRVVSQPRFVVPATSNTFADIFYQRFVDEPVDDLHLSTVYALSQPLGQGESFPTWIDDSFTLMTRYYCHYNLAHATRALPRAENSPITLITGLAAGLGDFLFNLILTTQNDFARSALDLFSQRSLRGAFWAV